jgi:hypothetical protein
MSAPVPPGLPPQTPYQAPLPPGKKPNILLWVIGGVVVVMLGITAMCGLGGYFLMKKAKDAGLSTESLQKNPGYALAKLAVTANPELEVISSDDDQGKITVREKNTGKVVSMKFDVEKKSMVVVDENGKETTLSIAGDGDKGSLTVKSSDGTVKIGGGAGNQMPAWVPVYPGSSPEGTFSASAKEGENNGYHFKTNDGPAKVLDYFQSQLKAAGFTISMASNTPSGGMVIGQDAAQNRTLTITVGEAGGGSEVNVMAAEKK